MSEVIIPREQNYKLNPGRFRSKIQNVSFKKAKGSKGQNCCIHFEVQVPGMERYECYARAVFPLDLNPGTEEPYHYLRIEKHRNHDYAIYGGEDHKTDQVKNTGRNYGQLEKSLHNLVPQAMVDPGRPSLYRGDSGTPVHRHRIWRKWNDLWHTGSHDGG
jgi:hypothetical protein